MSQSLDKIDKNKGLLVSRSEGVSDALWQQQVLHAFEDLKATVDSIGDALLTTDLQGKVQYLNPVAEQLTGWSVQQAVGKPINRIFNIIDEQTRQPTLSPIDLCLAESRLVTNASAIVLLSRNGGEYGIDESAAPIRDVGGNILGVVMTFRDVSEQRKLANEIAYRASHDMLTGLSNRDAFESALKCFVNNNREIGKMNALMFIDLDQFKRINDVCGYVAGDLMLKEVAALMQDCVRSSDMLARIGGDEFGIILRKCDAEKSMNIARSICNAVSEYRFFYEGSVFEVGTSIGLVMINESWESGTKLLQAADSACYRAKSEGRNRVHVYFDEKSDPDSMHVAVQWASRIEQALEEDKFVLFSQRIIPLNHTDLAHAEILIRMQGKNGELIPPSAFLQAAERLNMVTRIDKWVVKEVLGWMQTNRNALDHLASLSVNLSGQSLGDLAFHAYVVGLMDSMEIDCHKLCFEVTETSAITNIADADDFIQMMNQRGVKFSLDDFGSGVSSFGYLNSLSVDYLKIDGQFITDLVDNKIGQATVKCIAEVAKATGKQTIAEWVDNEPVEAMLKTMGIDFVQGYLKHKPAPLNYMLDEECAY